VAVITLFLGNEDSIPKDGWGSPEPHWTLVCKMLKLISGRDGGVAQVVECLHSKHEVLSPNSSTSKRKKKKRIQSQRKTNNPIHKSKAPWLTPIILATQEAGIKRILVQPGQIVHKTLSWKYPTHTKKRRWAQGVGPKFKSQYHTHTQNYQLLI
jgi:hypothetical protein